MVLLFVLLIIRIRLRCLRIFQVHFSYSLGSLKGLFQACQLNSRVSKGEDACI